MWEAHHTATELSFEGGLKLPLKRDDGGQKHIFESWDISRRFSNAVKSLNRIIIFQSPQTYQGDFQKNHRDKYL